MQIDLAEKENCSTLAHCSQRERVSCKLLKILSRGVVKTLITAAGCLWFVLSCRILRSRSCWRNSHYERSRILFFVYHIITYIQARTHNMVLCSRLAATRHQRNNRHANYSQRGTTNCAMISYSLALELLLSANSWPLKNGELFSADIFGIL
jgi:hypothetical protein